MPTTILDGESYEQALHRWMQEEAEFQATLYEPEEGDIRVRCGTLTYWLPNDPRADDIGNVDVQGLMVDVYGPRYSDDGLELTGDGVWRELCPLVDLPDMYPRLARQLPNLRCAAIAKATGAKP